MRLTSVRSAVLTSLASIVLATHGLFIPAPDINILPSSQTKRSLVESPLRIVAHSVLPTMTSATGPPADGWSWIASLPSHLQSLLRPADRPSDENANPADRTQSYSAGGVKLSDLMGKAAQISIFGSYARKSNVVFPLLDGDVGPDDQNTRFIVLAPSNKAIKSLPRLPWQTEKDEAEFGPTAYTGSAGQARADANIESFVRHHVLSIADSEGESLWEEGAPRVSFAQAEITYQVRDGVRYIQPGDIRVVDVVATATNGELWTIDGTLA